LSHTPQSLLCLIEEMGLTHVTVEHPPLRTVEESKRLRGALVGAHVKNLFLKARLRGRMRIHVLLVALEDRPVNLGLLRRCMGFKGLSFASEADLLALLGILPGSVSPLALVNAPAGAVILLLDSALQSSDWINFHPLSNGLTTRMSCADFCVFLDRVGVEPRWIDLPLSED